MAKAAEQAFTRWTEWTARRHTTCGLRDTPAKVRQTFWNLIARADREPLPSDGQTLTGEGIRADNRTWSHLPERYRCDTARHPLCGDFAATITTCAFWKQGSEPQTTIDNKVGALITQNDWDSQTPLFAGQAMHRALRGSRMLTVAGGEGHGVLHAPDDNPCADKAATVYLTTGRLPAKDLTCRATIGQK